MKKLSTVALVRCETYDKNDVKAAVENGFSLLGGISKFIDKGEKILLKPNVLAGDSPEKNVGPHPSVFRAIAEMFQGAGAKLTFGDSPGFGSPKGNARKAGLLDVAEELGIPFADFETAVEMQNPDGKLINKFDIAKGAAESDGLVSISKLKAHALTRITGAIKNQFGCIPGARKAEYHSVLPTALQFSKMLVDLNLLLKPRLYVMDGIIAMEGNGPRNGDPKPMHILLFSTDPVALDSIVCRMINLDTALVETLVVGEEFGLGTTENIILVGDDIDSFNKPDFVVNRSPASTTTGTSFLSKTFMRQLTAPRPTIEANLCTRCGTCVTVCPAEPKALSWVDDAHAEPPVYDYSKCIRCYCCQELCPESAIYIKTPWLGKLIRR